MNVTECLCCFALRQVAGEGAEKVLDLFKDQFSDRSVRISHALRKANDRAWRCLEIALAGESVWNFFDRADDKALRKQLKQFIDAAPLPDLLNRHKARQLILSELREARKKQLLHCSIEPGRFGQPLTQLTRFHDPQQLLHHERQLLRDMARLLKHAGYENLAWLLAQPAVAEDSLVVVAARYFFRREVERDERLAHALQFAATEALSAEQHAGFQELEAALAEHESRIEQALVELQAQILAALGRVEQQVAGQSEKLDEIKQLQAQVLELVKRLDMHQQTLRPGHSLSIRNDRERQLVKQLLARLRALPISQQHAHPALLDDVGKLLVAAGEFREAQETFERAARHAKGDTQRAEAYFNAYRAALEQGDFDPALQQLLQAAALDAARFAPFPLDVYEPRKILGAGGFGVTFLARHRLSRGEVAIKSLLAEELERDVSKVFAEAATLEELKHRCIIRLRDCNYADAAKRRPYLIMDYFPGINLEEYIQRHGPLKLGDAHLLAKEIAEALAAAHSRGILHRDVKPANVLIRLESEQLEVRLIDFGLALKHERLHSATASLRSGRSLVGSEIAGTLGYAAPEQLGRLPGVPIGPHSDIYGFGRTLSFALFGHPEPTYSDYRKLPEAMADLLDRCLQVNPQDRPRSFNEIVRNLHQPTQRPVSAQEVVQVALPAVPQVQAVLVEESQPRALPAERLEQRQQPRAERRHEWDEDEPIVRPRDPIHRRRREVEEAHDDDYQPQHRPIGTTTAVRIGTAVVAFLFGYLGLHKFVQGNVAAGILRIIITCTCIGFYINILISFIESIIYLFLSNEEYARRYIQKHQQWF